ncbi:hypothetical protein BS17DRAFT_769368 [Gyrodon lividus]|nr:hypothetical protein BS17DRAFT_769368 [Gyrodon lividus]
MTQFLQNQPTKEQQIKEELEGKKQKSKQRWHYLQDESSDESNQNDSHGIPERVAQSQKLGGHKKAAPDEDFESSEESNQGNDIPAKPSQSRKLGGCKLKADDSEDHDWHGRKNDDRSDQDDIMPEKIAQRRMSETQPKGYVDHDMDGIKAIPRLVDSSNSKPDYASNLTKHFPNGHKWPGLSCKEDIPINAPPKLRAALTGYEELYWQKGHDLALCMGMVICIMVSRECKKLGTIAHAVKHVYLAHSHGCFNGPTLLKHTTRTNADKYLEDNGVDDQVGDIHKKP